MGSGKVKWQTVVDVKSDVLFLSTNPEGLKRQAIQDALDIDYEYKTLYYFDNTVAYSGEDLDNFFNLVRKKLDKDKEYLFNFSDRVNKLAGSLLDYSSKIRRMKKLRDRSDSELAEIFSKYIKKVIAVFPLLLIIIPIEIIIVGELEKYVREKLKKQKRLDRFEEYIQMLTQRSVKETFFQEDYRNLLKIGKEIQGDSSLKKKFSESSPSEFIDFLKKNRKALYNKIVNHNSEYSWINMYMFRRNPFTLVELIKRLKDILNKDCDNTLKELNKKRKKTRSKFEEAIEDLEIKGDLKRKVEVLPEYVYLRTFRLDIFTLSAYCVRNFLLEIGARLKLNYGELVHLAYWEIRDALLGKSKVPMNLIEKRMKRYAAILFGGEFRIIVDKDELDYLQEEKEKKKVVDVLEIKGNVACKGKVKGPVKVVMHPTQITKVEKGDILVAPMTSPDFVIGMLKAIAIITDHGGITCHAAIVSRELNIPCVIATKIATKVLKDGDVVEVDAYNGIVKKI
jgi:phosphohistidine swiveling domain-containing protein